MRWWRWKLVVVIVLPAVCRLFRLRHQEHFLAFLEYVRHCAMLALCREKLAVNNLSEVKAVV